MRFTASAKGVLTKFAKQPLVSKTGKVALMKNKTITSVVKKLTKDVKQLKKVSYEKFTSLSAIANNQNLTADYNQYNLSRIYNQCVPIFGTSPTEISEVNKAMLTSKDIFVSIRQNNEPNFTRMSMFLVSLKDQGATTTVFDPASRSLVLTSVSDYTIPGNSYENVMINPKIFNVHAVKRFTMGVEGTAGPAADTYSQRRWKFTIKPKQSMIENPVGNVFNNSLFGSPIDPSQNYFLIIFNDNSIVDLEYPKIDVVVYDHWSVPN